MHYGKTRLNWPWIGPFVGFRHSTDYGHTWTPPPHTPSEPLFGETGMWGYPVKIGAPKFVDFGKNMEHSPDGKAYLVAHGADHETTSKNWRMWNDSWITGDQIYLLRVTPGIKTINDPSAYEFYGGRDKDGKPVWTGDFEKIKPLLEWDNNMGCVTVTYNPGLKKYIMCVTDGGNTVSRMDTYLLEADRLDGDWKIITYMKEFGTQAYFVNKKSDISFSRSQVFMDSMKSFRSWSAALARAFAGAFAIGAGAGILLPEKHMEIRAFRSSAEKRKNRADRFMAIPKRSISNLIHEKLYHSGFFRSKSFD